MKGRPEQLFREWVFVFIVLIDLFMVFPNQIDDCENRLAPKRQETIMKAFQTRLLRTWNVQNTKTNDKRKGTRVTRIFKDSQKFST
mgnify:CR=1 FL=1